MQTSFIPEVKKHHVKSLSELNDLYFAWIKTEYDNKVHSSTEMTPKERWDKSLAEGTKLRFFSPVELEEIFLHEEKRTVNKYGVISFEGNTYEVPATLIGKEVVVRYNPFHIDYLHIYYRDKYFGTGRIIDLKKQKHKDVESIPEESGYDSKISKLYFENIKSNFQKYLSEQLNLNIQKEVSGINPDEAGSLEDHPVKPPMETEVSITRNDFADIVKAAIGITELTFQEKGKLNELWDTFKEFNRDILTAILDDLSQKTTDFNRNFLYYITQIRTNYLEKLSKIQEDDHE
ncbi:MAG: hypothetical protein BWY74_00607 [Firmicutes bacterium ADurb.Bin419]|nr:MAG: hypothetical protein BWY74_00607 [Firmicutes bacterium ADurb.Bin419]